MDTPGSMSFNWHKMRLAAPRGSLQASILKQSIIKFILTQKDPLIHYRAKAHHSNVSECFIQIYF